MLLRRRPRGPANTTVKRRRPPAETPPPAVHGTGLTPTDLPRTIAKLIIGQPIPWPSDINPSLTSIAPHLNRATLLRSLDLIQPPAAALHFFLWSRAHLSSTIPLDDRAHYKMLQVLCRSQDLSAAREFLLSLHTDPPHDSLLPLHDRFFNVLIRAHARRGQLRQAISLFQDMSQEFSVPPSVFSFNALLPLLLRRGRTNAARDLFDEMTQGHNSVSPDVCTFNTLIRGFCMNGMVEEGFRFFRDMSSRWRCEPDVMTYNTLLDGLCRTGKVKIAHNLLNGMRKKKSHEVYPNVVSYTTVILGYGSKGLVSDALGVFRQMMEEGVEPNKVTHNILIQALCEAGETEKIKEIIGYVEGFKPDACTFNTLIAAHCKRGNIEEALDMFNKMPQMKVKPDSATYSTLIRTLCEMEDYVRAEELFDKLVEKDVLVKRGGCIPLMAAYNPIFEYLCLNGKAKKAGIVFRQLLKRSTLDVASYKILILGYCREGEFNDGYEILITMIRRDLVPDEVTCQALIDGFLEKGDMEFAWKALEKMLNSGHRPKTAVFHSVLVGLLNNGNRCTIEAADLVVVMLERKIRQNIDLSTGVVANLYKNGHRERGFQIVHLLYVNGYKVNMENLTRLLCDDQKFLEAQELLLFSLEKHQHLSGEVYIEGIHGLCQNGNTSEAFRLYYELNESMRGHDVSNCLEDLQICLEREGKLREAEFVRKRKTFNTRIDNNHI